MRSALLPFFRKEGTFVTLVCNIVNTLFIKTIALWSAFCRVSDWEKSLRNEESVDAISIAIYFRKPCSKGWRAATGIKMRYIAKGRNPELRSSLSAFFCINCGDRGRSGTESMPKLHGRDVEKMR